MSTPGAGGYFDLGGCVEQAEVCEYEMTQETIKKAEAMPTLQEWEQRVDATVQLLGRKKLLTVDMMRRGIEALPIRSAKEDMPYYVKWAASLTSALREAGVLSEKDIRLAIGDVTDGEKGGSPPKFEAGARVRVKAELQDGKTRWRKPHLRVPGYLFGACGVVERLVGEFPNPEMVAFDVMSDARSVLYRVRFTQAALWKGMEKPYDGPEDDTIDVEVYESWLEADTDDGAAPGDAEVPNPKRAKTNGTGHAEHDHEHLSRAEIEQKAVDDEGEPALGQHFAEAVVKLIIDKDIVSATELRETIERTESYGTKMEGPRVVARAWTDPAFKKALLEDANAAVAAMGIAPGRPHASTKLVVLENTPTVHNFVVCTLCSCYPRSILGMSPGWYKSRSYRSRAVIEPRKLLADLGLSLKEGVAVRVHDSTADCRYMILPLRPEGTDDYSEEDLQKLVTRDSIIGVSVPHI